MSALLFTLVFQGLAVVAALCVLAAIVQVLPFMPKPLSALLSKLASPVLLVVHAITPLAVPRALHLTIAVFWLLLLRLGFHLAAGSFGLLPAITS
jgi:hypothetical protein